MLSKFKKAFQSQSNIPLDEKRKDHITRVGIGLIFLGGPYIPLFLFFGFTNQAIAVTPCLIFFIFSIFLNKKGAHNIAGLLLITTVSVAILYFASVLGKNSGAHTMYFAMAALPISFFKRDNLRCLILGFVIPITSYFVLHGYMFKAIIPIEIPPLYESYIQLTISITVFSIIIGSIKLFANIAVESEIKLIENNKQLQTISNEISTLYININKDILAAQKVQQSTIPDTFPQPKDMTITHWYQAANGIGGDFMDGIVIDEHRTLIIIGDIVGKGIQASLKMAAVYPVFRMVAETYTTMQDLVERCSKEVEKFYNLTQYIPCVVGLIDSQTNTFTYCNAGHETGYIFRDTDTILLDLGGPPFGADINATYIVTTIPLQKNDRILFFTDGFTDIKNPTGDRLESKGLLPIIQEFHHSHSDTFIETLSAKLMTYKHTADQADDMSIISVMVK